MQVSSIKDVIVEKICLIFLLFFFLRLLLMDIPKEDLGKIKTLNLSLFKFNCQWSSEVAVRLNVSNFLFQRDNADVHSSQVHKEMNPDLNPIQHR